jgi:hypothetical protein
VERAKEKRKRVPSLKAIKTAAQVEAKRELWEM